MPFKAFISHAGDNLTTIISPVLLSLFSGLAWIVGTTAGPSVVLNGQTQVQGSPYALGSIIGCVAVATWVVAMLVNRILTQLKEQQAVLEALKASMVTLNEKREKTENQLTAIQAHMDDFQNHGRKR